MVADQPEDTDLMDKHEAFWRGWMGTNMSGTPGYKQEKFNTQNERKNILKKALRITNDDELEDALNEIDIPKRREFTWKKGDE